MTARLVLALALWGGLAGSMPQESQEPPPVSENDEIRFRITGIRDAEGRMVCGLFNRQGWPRRGMPGAGGRIHDGEAVCVFRDVSPGRYAIVAYHDSNGNQKLDLSFLRVPKEGICASNDARGVFGPPRFKKSSFAYEGGVLDLEARLRY